MACIECRRRRIKCDSARPKCYHCSRLSKSCEYASAERRRGPKRRSVKDLEDRLAFVEAKLNSSNSSSSPPSLVRASSSTSSVESATDAMPVPHAQALESSDQSSDLMGMLNFVVPPVFPAVPSVCEWPAMSSHATTLQTDGPPTMSLEEIDRFPDLAEIQELHAIFFDEVYPCIPILHVDRHNPNRLTMETQDPLCLRYAMWAQAAQRSAKYVDRAARFYKNARMHLEHDEMQGDGLGLVSVAHVQACILIASFEAETGTPARAFMSNRRAIALSSMIGLHAQDSADNWACFKILKPPRDVVEAEERRRTFWFLFYSDRWASSASGKSASIKESEIATLLPASEKAFHEGLTEQRQSLQDALDHGILDTMAPLSIAVISGLLLSTLNDHLRRLQEDVKEQRNPAPGFWLRHQQIDNEITKILLDVPSHMRPSSTSEPLAFFGYMCLQEYLVTLFQTAAAFSQKYSSSIELSTRLRTRARQAAEKIIEAMGFASFLGIRKMFPSTPTCLYLASSVFVTDLRTQHNVEHAKEMLRFIVHTMRLFRKHWSITQMFLEQLLLNLKECDFNIELNPDDTVSMKCYQQFGDDLSSLGPLFATNLALVQTKSGEEILHHVDGPIQQAVS